MGETVFAELREQFVDRVTSLPLSTVERAGTGDLVSRTTNDVEALSHVVRFGIPSLFVAVVTTTLTVVAAVLTGPLVALPIVLGVPFIWFSTRRYLRHAPDGYLRERATYAVAQRGRHRDGRRRPHGRRAAARRPRRRQRSTRRSRELLRRRALHAAAAADLVPPGRVRLPAPGRRRACSGAAGWSSTGHTTVGTVTAVALYVQQMIDPLDELLIWLDELQVGATSLARLLGVARRAAGPRRPPASTPRRRARRRRRRPARLPRGPRRAARRRPRPRARASGWPWSARPAPASPRSGRLLAGIDGPRTGPGRRRRRAAGRPGAGRAARPGRAGHPGAPRLRRHPARTTCCWPGRPPTRDELVRRAATRSTRAAWAPALPRRAATRVVGTGGHALTDGPGPAARAGPAGAGRPAHAGARRGHLAARPARRPAPGAVAGRRAARAARWSRSRTGCTPRTTPTGSPWSRTAASPSSAPTTSWSPPTAPTPRCGARGGTSRPGRAS